MTKAEKPSRKWTLYDKIVIPGGSLVAILSSLLLIDVYAEFVGSDFIKEIDSILSN